MARPALRWAVVRIWGPLDRAAMNHVEPDNRRVYVLD